ncbi:MarR family winged helix-turn-helix transcriptional regulator [Paenibacillus yanchengensis]|uniref:MarR family winged helix-turn-helix transcriptional regulator n=1 Tax=Paenibacillus yanchengensis TaxID=2035833 RepID=A0ABW4YGL8_9BACL
MNSSEESTIIDRLQSLYIQLNAKFGSCTGISPSRFRLLQTLHDVDEINQTSLQKELKIDGAAITRHLKQMEADRIIVRRKCPKDNRVTLVKLTDDGRQKIITYREEKIRFLTQMLDGFSPEEQTLLSSMIERMQGNIKNIIGEMEDATNNNSKQF